MGLNERILNKDTAETDKITLEIYNTKVMILTQNSQETLKSSYKRGINMELDSLIHG